MYLQFLDLKKRFNWSHNELEKPCMVSAKRLDVLCSINKDTLLLPPINMKRLRDETLSTLWQVTMKHTITTYRRKLGNSNKKQTRDSHKDKWTLLSQFSLEANQALENQRERFFGNGSDIISMETRRARKRCTYRTLSSSTTPGRRYATSKLRIRWTTSALDKVGSGDAAMSRNV